MQISTAVLFVASLALTTTTIDAQPQHEKGILRVPLTRQSRPDPIISAMQKRNSALTKRDPFLASLYNDQGSQYLIDISVGTPAQNFSVTLDTGSADLWIPGSSCPTSECPNGVYAESRSSTFKSLGQPFTLTYGIGSVNGTYATDTVSIAGATVQNQQFGLASDTQQILTNANTITVTQNSVSKNIKNLAAPSSSTPIANGILGLGYPKLTASSSKGQGSYNPFVFNLATQNIIAQPVFSIFMNSASKTGWSGEIIFGGIDHTKYTGNLTYMPVVPLSSTNSKNKKRAMSSVSTSDYYWMVYGQGVSVGDSSNSSSANTLNIPFTTTGAFILDTGTTLTYLPAEMAKQVVTAAVGPNGYSVDAGSGTYLVDCNAVSSTATFVLNMAGSSSANAAPITLSIPMSQLVIPLDSSSRSSANYCLFGIAPSTSVGVGSNLYLVGDSVLRSAYLVFDMGNNQIGIAAANGGGGAVDGLSAAAQNTAVGSYQRSILYTVGALAVTASIMLAL